jgi:hypothetical protein
VAKNLLGEKLARDRDGTIIRDIGYEQKGEKRRPRRFWFGRDDTQAVHRILHVKALWAKVVAYFDRERQGEEPVWEEDTYQIARAVARGEETAYIDVPAWVTDAEGQEREKDIGLWLLKLQQTYNLPFITIRLRDQGTEQAANEVWERERAERRRSLERISPPSPTTTQTLHQALDAFKEYLGRKYVVPGTIQITKHGKKVREDIDRLKEHQDDMLLSDFDLDAIERIIDHWRSRPLTKRKKPAAPDTVRGQIKALRAFVKWLHRSKEFAWRKPMDYEVEAVRVPMLPGEVSQKARQKQVKTYTPEEIGILWEYATPRVRLYMTLALNCGFGNGELATLQREEVLLDAPRPDTNDKGNWICRVRNKRAIYGEWKLWDITAKALRWYLARRQATPSEFLILNEKGKPINTLTKGSNGNQHVFNRWKDLLDAVRKDHPEFRRLSFNKLRKTSINGIRKYEGAEVAKVFAAHGETSTDDMIDRYSNRDFEAVFRGIDKVGIDLAPIFARVPDPFPADAKKRHPHYSLGTIKRIEALAAEGKGRATIAKEVGVSEGMVRYYLDRAKAAKAKKEEGAKE